MKFTHNDPLLKDRRKELRNYGTAAEATLWNHVKSKKLGKKFRRQFGIGPYIVDFYCCETKLVIELDGDYHDYQLEYDQERDDFLRSNGCNIVRFPNEMIHGSLQKVLEVIKEKLISS